MSSLYLAAVLEEGECSRSYSRTTLHCSLWLIGVGLITFRRRDPVLDLLYELSIDSPNLSMLQVVYLFCLVSFAVAVQVR